MFLGRYERKYAHRLPPTELRSRALQKLARATASSRMHLAVLVHRVVIQAHLDYGKEMSRHYQHFEYDYTFDFLDDQNELAPFLQDRLQDLFSEDSPLDAGEKLLIQTALEDPVLFIGPDGHPVQSALGPHFGVNQSTICRRWAKILDKVATWRSATKREVTPPPPAVSI